MPSDVQPFHTVYLNSNDAQGDPWKHTYTLPGNLIPLPKYKEGAKVRVGILSATFPGASTNVNAMNNTIVWRENILAPPSSTLLTATIPVGSYTDATLTTAVKTAMDAATVNGIIYDITQTGGIISFAVDLATPNAADYEILLLTGSRNFTALELLGMEYNTIARRFSSTVTFVAPYQINLLNFSGSPEILVRCSSLTSSCYEARIKGSSDIIAVCQNTVLNEDSSLIYQTSVPKILMEVQYNPSQLSFLITDEEEQVLEGLRGPVTMLLGCYYYV